MSKSTCAVCTEPAGAAGQIFNCNGVCRGKFHLSCVSKSNNAYKKDLIKVLAKIPNLKWFCDDCLPLSANMNGLADSLTKTTNEISQWTSILTPLFDKFSADASKIELACQNNVDAHHSMLGADSVSNESAAMDTSTAGGGGGDDDDNIGYIGYSAPDIKTPPCSARSKRKIDSPDVLESSKKIRIDAHPIAASSSVNSDSSNANNVFPEPQNGKNPFASTRSIYVSGFHPSKTSEQIVEDLKRQGIDTKAIWRCNRLVSRNKNVNELTFVSFKIAVLESHYDTFVDRKLWPNDVNIREFKNKLLASKSGFQQRRAPMAIRNRPQSQSVGVHRQQNSNNSNRNRVYRRQSSSKQPVGASDSTPPAKNQASPPPVMNPYSQMYGFPPMPPMPQMQYPFPMYPHYPYYPYPPTTKM